MSEDVLDLIYQAGDKTLEFFGQEDLQIKDKGITGPNDLVTNADIASHKILVKGLQDLGATQILSEESEDYKSFDWSKEVRIIDPIDGTSAFIRGEDGYSILVAKSIGGVIDFGVMYFPVTGKLYFAHKGEGCREILNNQKKRVYLSDATKSKYSTKVAIWRGREDDEYVKMILSFLDHQGLTKEVVYFGRESGGLLSGELDYFIESYYLGKWDVAAPSILIQEAGGFICDILGNDIDFIQSENNYFIPVIAGKIHLKDQLLGKLN